MVYVPRKNPEQRSVIPMNSEKNSLPFQSQIDQVHSQVRHFGSKLYHYTSISALKGIVDNNEFWLCDPLQMNDSQELTNFINEIEVALLQDCPNSKPDICKLFKDINRKIESERPYIASFSKNKDDAAQWERYGDFAHGICLVISTNVLSRCAILDDMGLCKIFYSENPRKHELYKYLKEFYTTGMFPQNCGFTDISQIPGNAIPTSSGYKNFSFASENEIRLISDFTKHGCEKDVLCDNKIKHIYAYRPSKYALLGQVITGIILGPKSTQNVNDLKHFLTFRGYEKIAQNIELSKSSLR